MPDFHVGCRVSLLDDRTQAIGGQSRRQDATGAVGWVHELGAVVATVLWPGDTFPYIYYLADLSLVLADPPIHDRVQLEAWLSE